MPVKYLVLCLVHSKGFIYACFFYNHGEIAKAPGNLHVWEASQFPRSLKSEVQQD